MPRSPNLHFMPSPASPAFKQQKLKADVDIVCVLQLPTLCINKTLTLKKRPWVYSLLKMGLRSTNLSTYKQWLEVGTSHCACVLPSAGNPNVPQVGAWRASPFYHRYIAYK